MLLCFSVAASEMLNTQLMLVWVISCIHKLYQCNAQIPIC